MAKVSPSGEEQAFSKAFILAGTLLVAAMLTCFVAGLAQIGRFFFPDWRGGYWLVVGFFAALDGLVMQRALRRTHFPETDWLLTRFSEWVMFAVLLKLGFYLSNGLIQAQADFASLVNQMWTGFFSGEFLLGFGAMIVVWALAGQYAEYLWKLEVNEELIRVEQESGIYEKRAETRESLASLTLALGLVLTLAFALLRSPLSDNWRSSIATSNGTHLILFFCLSLALLSLTQYSLLRFGWVRDGIPTGKDILSRWLVSGGLLILLLVLLALILPTDYSIGFIQLFQAVLTILVTVGSFIWFILWSPVFIFLSFLASLMGKSVDLDAPLPPEAFFPPPAAETQTPLPWLELLKSLFVWGLLISAVLFAVIYYVREHKTALDLLRKASLLIGWSRFWQWLGSWMKRANLAAAATVREGLAGLRERLSRRTTKLPGSYLSLRDLSPRQRVFFYYLALLRRGEEKGYRRAPAQTPYEYFQSLEKRISEKSVGDGEDQGLPEWLDDAQTLTDAYIQARYSSQAVSSEQIGFVRQAWDRIRKGLRKL